MFLVIPGQYALAPVLADVKQDQTGTAFFVTIGGKQGVNYTIEFEKETVPGNGIFSAIGTSVVSIIAGSSRIYQPLTLAGVTFPGTVGYNYRCRIINPVMSLYSNAFTSVTTYYAAPAVTQISASINGGRTQVTISWADPATTLGTGTGALRQMDTTFIEAIAGTSYPHVHNVIASPFINPGRWDFQITTSYDYGRWVITNNGVI